MVIWIIIALGIYQCGVTVDFSTGEREKEQKEEPGENSAEEGPIVEEAEVPFDTSIRVLIKSSGYSSIYHKELRFTGTEGLVVEHGNALTEYQAGEEYCVDTSVLQNGASAVIRCQNEGKIKCLSIERSEDCAYRGRFVCYGTEDGIVLINELSVEEYLYGVVPSEMPSSYPMEAQKAQAIGARTYAYYHKKSYAYPEWRAHVDDSTAFQVYMNINETEAGCQAVDETKNLVLKYKGELIQSFYYSTSGGYSGGSSVWGESSNSEEDYLIETGEDIFAENSAEGEQKYRAYIDNENELDLEYQEPWYRWEYVKTLSENDRGALLKRLYDMYLLQPEKVKIRSGLFSADKLVEEESIKDIRVLNRQKSGLVTSLMIETEHFRINVRTQHCIRQALAGVGDVIVKSDGSEYSLGEILPSAYFYIEKSYDNNAESGDTLKEIVIRGAGLGHGAGMSQNGAKCLAAKGFTASEILAYYYKGSVEAVE